jgi:hypothetical protein
VNIQPTDDEGNKEAVISFEDWKKNLKAKKLEYDLFLPASSFYEISEENFYHKECKFAFSQSNLLYKFYFDQFGKKHNDKIYDHNILLLLLLSFCKDSNQEKVEYFYKILTKMGIVSIKNFADYLRIYLETTIFGVINKIFELSQDEENLHYYKVFLKDNKADLENEITCFINEITGMYNLKDQNEEKIYLVEESDFSTIFKNKEFIFNFEELWKYFLEKADIKKRHY